MTARNPPPLAAVRRTAIPLVVATALLLGFPDAPPTEAASDAELATALDTLFAEAYPADRPGAAVRIETGREVVLRKGYGLADPELGVPIEPDTVFRLGSITKQFTNSSRPGSSSRWGWSARATGTRTRSSPAASTGTRGRRAATSAPST